jgi:hypothetical protein
MEGETTMSTRDAVDDEDVAEAMRKCGGSFVHILGELWAAGDPANRALIKTTWAEYWTKYRALAESWPREEPPDV